MNFLEPAVLAAIISSVISMLSALIIRKRWKREFKLAENKIFEEITGKQVSLRVKPYAEFMQELKLLSSLKMNPLSPEEKIVEVKKMIEVLQNTVFGEVGLLASHETRETIMFFISRCLKFVNGDIEYSQVKKASWKVHQMLRSDLGLPQPGLLNSLEKMKKEELAGTEPQILKLLDGMHHNHW